MSISIQSFADAGAHPRERLVLKVHDDMDLGRFAVFVSHMVEGAATADRQAAAFWFPDGRVKEGDLVVLYTKPGNARVKELAGDRKAHFFYFGLKNAVWAGDKYKAVLLQIDSYEISSLDDIDELEDE